MRRLLCMGKVSAHFYTEKQMKEYSVTLREKVRQIDYGIILCIVMMSIMSIVTLAGAADAYGDSYYKTQTISMLIGLVCLAVVSMIDYDALINKLKYVFFLLSIGLLAVVIFF